MTVDFTITIGNIFEIVSIIGGGMMMVAMLRSEVKTLKSGAENLNVRIDAVHVEMKKLNEILIEIANVRGEIKAHDIRIAGTEQDIRDLRHGDGFIVRNQD